MVFSERDTGEWYYAGYVNGTLRLGMNLTRVGSQMAGAMMRSSQSIEAEAEIILTDGMLVVIGDDSTLLWKEKIPQGVKYKVIRNTWVLLRGDFSLLTGQLESCYVAFRPDVVSNDNDNGISPNWIYIIGDKEFNFHGTIAENLGRFLK